MVLTTLPRGDLLATALDQGHLMLGGGQKLPGASYGTIGSTSADGCALS